MPLHRDDSKAAPLFLPPLSKVSSVRSFVQRFKATYDAVDILVLNAGLNTGGVTPDGLDCRWQCNFLGHW